MSYQPISFTEAGDLILLDQRKLPNNEEFVTCSSLNGVHSAIKDMVVRGAPCIGFTAIFGMALWLKNNDYSEKNFLEACDYLGTARPTAVNLFFEIERVKSLVLASNDKSKSFDLVKDFGLEQMNNSEIQNRKMSNFALEELSSLYGMRKLNILTHCNTGFLACGSHGTALGVVQSLSEVNRINCVWVDETRPYLQGSRLTSFELTKLGIDHKIVVEGAASYLMREKLVDAIFVGADRIVKNGDTANKIGTSNLAVIANFYKVPFYVVAPSSSFDLNAPSGADIEIELRDSSEVLQYQGQQIAPFGAQALNPSFDVTEGELITGIISENGIVKGDYAKSLRGIVSE